MGSPGAVVAAAPVRGAGGHLAHVVLLGVWLGVVVGVVVVDHLWSRRRGSRAGGENDRPAAVGTAPPAGPPLPGVGVATIVTWPPRRGRDMTNSDSLTAPLVSRPAVPARPARNPAARNPAARNRAARTPARGHTAWLGLAVVASLTAAAVHVWVLPDHVRESYLYGAFFAGAASGQLLFAVLLARRPGRLLLRTGAWASGAVVLLWLYTRTAGVPVGPGAGGVEPVGVQDALATAAEVLTVLSCAACLRLPGGVGPLRWRPGPLRCAGERPGARTPTPAWRGPSEEATCR